MRTGIKAPSQMPLVKKCHNFGTNFESGDLWSYSNNLASSVTTRNHSILLCERILSCLFVSKRYMRAAGLLSKQFIALLDASKRERASSIPAQLVSYGHST